MTQNNGNGPDRASAHLVQLLLPLRRDSIDQDRAYLDRLRETLTERFGGVTAYLRAPAVGEWKDENAGEVQRDEIVIVEVMAEELEPNWWAELRERIRIDLEQEELVVRALPYVRL